MKESNAHMMSKKKQTISINGNNISIINIKTYTMIFYIRFKSKNLYTIKMDKKGL